MFHNDPDYVDPYNGSTGGFYGVGFYGADEYGFGWGEPVNLNAYQNNPETVTLYWSIKPYDILIHDMTWEIQTDLVDTFDSADLITYQTHSGGIPVADFIYGCVHKGLSVPIYTRGQSVVKRMYWRVKGIYGSDFTMWRVGAFDIPAAIDVSKPPEGCSKPMLISPVC